MTPVRRPRRLGCPFHIPFRCVRGGSRRHTRHLHLLHRRQPPTTTQTPKQQQVAAIRKGVEMGADTSVCLLNYRADGTPFWNQFFVAPLRDLNGDVVYYVGAQVGGWGVEGMCVGGGYLCVDVWIQT